MFLYFWGQDHHLSDFPEKTLLVQQILSIDQENLFEFLSLILSYLVDQISIKNFHCSII